MSLVLFAAIVMCALAITVEAADTRPADAKPVRGPIVLTEEAIKLHRSCLVFDGHNDLPWAIRMKGNGDFNKMDIAHPQPNTQTDIPRLIKGGVGAQFWAAYVPANPLDGRCPTAWVLEQIDIIHRMGRRYPDLFEIAYCADDIERIHRQGRIACVIGLEGGHVIGDSLGTLRMLHQLGARYMTLTHGDTNNWCDSATDASKHDGLTSFGEDVVREMNRLGMLVDISHISWKAMDDVLRVSTAPIVASHSAVDGVASHPRNVPDEVLERMARNGGVVMINFFSGYVHPEGARVMQKMFDVERDLHARFPNEADYKKARDQWKAQNPYPRGNVHDVVDHIDYVVKKFGVDHVGLGADYDGVSVLPEQLEDVSGYPYITQELLNRGYKPDDIRKILGGNVVRLLRAAEAVAKTQASEKKPAPAPRAQIK